MINRVYNIFPESINFKHFKPKINKDGQARKNRIHPKSSRKEVGRIFRC
jgi:hypothetical protein